MPGEQAHLQQGISLASEACQQPNGPAAQQLEVCFGGLPLRISMFGDTLAGSCILQVLLKPHSHHA